MNAEELVAVTAQHVERLFAGEGSGHDWWHIKRVWQNALKIGAQEKADLTVVQLGALLHDIADWKFHGGDEEAGPRAAATWLREQEAPETLISDVCQIIREVSFKGAGVDTTPSTLEVQVVQDADRLDAIGAIGIGRAFAYGGFKGREMYHPHQEPLLHASFEEYKKNQGPTLNHFYEKLFLLKERLNTTAGRQLAQERHSYMQEFVRQFLLEWHGEEPAPAAFHLQAN
ncbi:HD domain-containing protein [Rufibacter glacialis]|uniref:HD domain-containing protein n=1 Tax=Rufibacter glacialis TaxID=1259555 RepID=A0A5M8QDY2_9BACT|nr:HD domain-containing protein [Rufibacter glacialis]KAA6434247.1 HD domain-containing protein [Rufibacter glacialis]GGK68075.1 phosphohydrolase [Rufibacter glacialis]